MTCCVIPPPTGNSLWDESNQNPRIQDAIRQQILRLINEFGVRRFIIGMEYNLDFFVANTISEIRETIPLTLEYVLQSNQLNQYLSIINIVDKIIITKDFPNKFYIQKHFLNSSQFAISFTSGKSQKRYDEVYFSWSKNNCIIINADDLSINDYFCEDGGNVIVQKIYFKSGYIEQVTVLSTYSGTKTFEDCAKELIDYNINLYSK